MRRRQEEAGAALPPSQLSPKLLSEKIKSVQKSGGRVRCLEITIKMEFSLVMIFLKNLSQNARNVVLETLNRGMEMEYFYLNIQELFNIYIHIQRSFQLSIQYSVSNPTSKFKTSQGRACPRTT